jgi:serine/threonine protein kinase
VAENPNGKDEALPRPFGKYTLQREAGRGGKGVVYEALDTVLQRRVALKVSIRGPKAGPEELKAEEERFLLEARIGAFLPKHDNIIGVYEAGEIEGQRYLSTEYVEGEPMARWRKNSNVTMGQQVRMLRDVALAMEHAHAHGVIHRDLKPANVLVDKGCRPHVTDFGLAKMAGQKGDTAKSLTGKLWGTPAYMSPEHARGLEVDCRTDVYALGVMLYEILAGHTPFRGATSTDVLGKVVRDVVVAPSKVVRAGTLSSRQLELEPVCMKALSKDPAGRHRSAKEFAEELTPWLDYGKTVRKEEKKPKSLIIGGIAAAAFLAVILTVVMATRKKGPSPEDLKAREAEQARLSERREQEKNRAATEAAAGARKEAEAQAKGEKEQLQKEMEARRKADEEAALKEQARLEAQRREAEARAKKAEDELNRPKETPPPVPPPTPPPTPPVTPPVAPPEIPEPPPAAPAERLSAGLLAHWKMNEGKGQTARDSSGKDRHGTLQGGAEWVVSAKRRALGFDGATGFLDSGAAFPELATAFTFALWVNPAAEQKPHANLLATHSAPPIKGASLEQSAHPNAYYFVMGNANGWQVSRPPVQLTADTWQHLAAVFDTTEVVFYLDGVEKVRFKTVGHPVANTKDTLKLGQGCLPNRFFKGLLSDVRIYGRALPAAEVLAIAKAKTEAEAPIVLPPVPEAGAVAEAEKQVRDLFKAEYVRKGTADRVALAQKLLKAGEETKGEPALAYVALREARDLAAAAGDLDLALKAVGRLDERFQVDATGMKAAAFLAAVRAVEADDAEAALATGEDLLDQLVRDCEFDTAVKMLSPLEDLARRLRNAESVKTVQARSRDVKALQSEWARIKPAVENLKADPGDAEACLAVGRFHATARNWEAALPLLAKGSHPGFKEAAEKDLAGPADAPGRADAGDLWWALSEKEKAPLKVVLQARAVDWYQQSMEGLPTLRRLQVEKRVQAAVAGSGGSGSALERLKAAGLVFWVHPMGDPAGRSADLVSGAPATNVGPVATVTDSGIKALKFSSSCTTYPASDAVRAIQKTGSYLVWIKPEASIPTYAGVIFRGVAPNPQDPQVGRGFADFSLFISADRLIAFFNWPETSWPGVDGSTSLFSKRTLQPGKWAMCGATWDGATVATYINGERDSFARVALTPLRRKGPEIVVLANDPAGTPEYFNGLIASAMIFNRALAEAEVRQMFLTSGLRGK